jgi:enoyl-[acyl-carrier protein] reductase I
MLAVARKLDAINEWGVCGPDLYGGTKDYPFYTDMADIKAMLESIARSFGYHYGVEKKFVSIPFLNHPQKQLPAQVSKVLVISLIMQIQLRHLVMPLQKIAPTYCIISVFPDLTRMCDNAKPRVA